MDHIDLTAFSASDALLRFIVESMDHIDLTAFSASDARKVIFLLQFLSSPRRRLAPTVSIDSYNKVLWTAWRSFVVVIMLNIFIC